MTKTEAQNIVDELCSTAAVLGRQVVAPHGFPTSILKQYEQKYETLRRKVIKLLSKSETKIS